MFRGFRHKLYPTPQQDTQCLQSAGVCRLIYNRALAQRRDLWRETGKSITYFDQARDLTALRAGCDWIAAVTQTCQQQALRDLDRAFRNFFEKRAAYPKFRCKGVKDRFRYLGREVKTRRINGRYSEVRLPKIGWVKYRDTRPLEGTIKNVTVTLDADGWYVSFGCEIEHTAPVNTLPAVGIDRGVANTLFLSTGEVQSMPTASLDAIDKRLRKAQRRLARKKRGSKRRWRQLRRCAKLAAKRARKRRDFQHKASLSIAQRFGTVVLEDLKIKNMTASAKGTVDAPGKNVKAKAGLNRSILNQGWFSFQVMLEYKLNERGGTLHFVNPAYTSQTCSACGTVDRESRESQAVFVCRHCGFRAHADHNAAINILRRASSDAGEETTAVEHTVSARGRLGRKPPVETRTPQVGSTPLGNPPASA